MFFGSQDNRLYAIDPNGTLKWSYSTGGKIVSSPAIGVDRTVHFGSYDKNLYALNPDGTLKWSFQTNRVVQSSPALGADGTIYFSSLDAFYALSPQGELIWSFSGITNTSSPVIDANGNVYFLAEDWYYRSTEGNIQLIVDNRLYAFHSVEPTVLMVSPEYFIVGPKTTLR